MISCERNVVPMHERRPDWLDAIIDRHEIVAKKPPPDYTHNGSDDEYRYKLENSLRISASQLLEAGPDLRVLDIGAARGAFVQRAQRLGHTAHALSIHDYRRRYYGITGKI